MFRIVAPIITPFSFDDEAMNAGDLVVIQCSAAKGDSPMILSWYFHGHQVTSDQSGISINKLGDRISVLSIQSVTAGHNGDYTCSAKNLAGTANYTATLTVNGSNRLKNFTSLPYPLMIFLQARKTIPEPPFYLTLRVCRIIV